MRRGAQTRETRRTLPRRGRPRTPTLFFSPKKSFGHFFVPRVSVSVSRARTSAPRTPDSRGSPAAPASCASSVVVGAFCAATRVNTAASPKVKAKERDVSASSSAYVVFVFVFVVVSSSSSSSSSSGFENASARKDASTKTARTPELSSPSFASDEDACFSFRENRKCSSSLRHSSPGRSASVARETSTETAETVRLCFPATAAGTRNASQNASSASEAFFASQKTASFVASAPSRRALAAAGAEPSNQRAVGVAFSFRLSDGISDSTARGLKSLPLF
mmetsp:Transcript_13798/g.59020  ORF Transcript_13798/g.59020 Transcript_13798/m.59020 type:complete len:278 (-) Transcript_13798:452-1285(-)